MKNCTEPVVHGQNLKHLSYSGLGILMDLLHSPAMPSNRVGWTSMVHSSKASTQTGNIQKRQGWKPLFSICKVTLQLSEWIWVIYFNQQIITELPRVLCKTNSNCFYFSPCSMIRIYAIRKKKKKKITGHMRNRPPEKPAMIMMFLHVRSRHHPYHSTCRTTNIVSSSLTNFI